MEKEEEKRENLKMREEGRRIRGRNRKMTRIRARKGEQII